MSFENRFETINNDQQASRLMPGGSPDPHLVLFCGHGASVFERAERLIEQAGLPTHWQLARVDPEEASDTARWFGLGQTPSMAVIRRGVILAIEQECSPDAFERLVREALKRETLVETA